MSMSTKRIFPGDKVLAFDPRVYVNDVATPSFTTWRPATVVSRYGRKEEARPDWPEHIYDDLVDLSFDYRPNDISKGHFTEGVKVIAFCAER